MASKTTMIADHALIGSSAHLPTTAATPTISMSPITLASPSRPVPLQLRLTAPTTGANLPIILLSHGHGQSNHLSSLNGYGPLVSHWAGHGFAVIQPTHLSSKSLSLPKETAGAPMFWRERVEDMKSILNQLEELEDEAPFIKGRLDHERVAVVGHSLGSNTASLLLGLQTRDLESGDMVNLAEPRIKAGIVLAAIGDGGDALTEWARENLPFHREVDFKEMKAPTLVVAGDDDPSTHLTTRGWKWHADPYYLSSGPKSLFTLFGGDHCLSGISGYDAAETQGESVERVAAVQRMTSAYLKSALYPEDQAWPAAVDALRKIGSLGEVESK